MINAFRVRLKFLINFALTSFGGKVPSSNTRSNTLIPSSLSSSTLYVGSQTLTTSFTLCFFSSCDGTNKQNFTLEYHSKTCWLKKLSQRVDAYLNESMDGLIIGPIGDEELHVFVFNLGGSRSYILDPHVAHFLLNDDGLIQPVALFLATLDTTPFLLLFLLFSSTWNLRGPLILGFFYLSALAQSIDFCFFSITTI